MILFQPLVRLMEILFLFNYNLLTHYGYSLVLLSFEVSLILLPLAYLAEKWKDKEEAVQLRMKGSIDSIKECYSGQKRYYLIREVHRLHHYRSIYSLRVSFGLLIQIPFFFAAYNFLSHFSGYQGISFGPLQNLSRPDTLLFGFSLMPLVMTAVNLLGSFIYTRGKKFSEIMQFVLMALLFLILLYDRPSGLVFYWTMNNVFAIVKNIYLKKVFPHRDSLLQTMTLYEYIHSDKGKVLLAAVPLVCFALGSAWLDKYYSSGKYLIAGLALFMAFLSLVFLIEFIKRIMRGKARFVHLLYVVLLFIPFLIIAWDNYTEGYLELHYANTFLRTILLLLLVLIIGYELFFIFRREDFLPSIKASERMDTLTLQIYWFSIVFLGLFFFFISPFLLYRNTPSEISSSLYLFVFGNVKPFVIYLVITSGLFLIARRHRMVVQTSLSLVLITLLYYYLLPADYGLLDVNSLMGSAKLDTLPLILYIVDASIIAGLFWLAGRLIRQYPRQTRVGFYIVMIGILVEIGISLSSIPEEAVGSEISSKAVSVVHLPENSRIVHSFSKEGKNVLLILPDMFTGGYIQRMIEEEPELINPLDGFTWYLNTISNSFYTVTSVPAMLGGPGYDPLVLNEKPGLNRDKTTDAYNTLLNPLLDLGFNMAMTDSELLPPVDRREAIALTHSAEYYQYWRNVNGYIEKPFINEDLNRTIVTMLGLFKAAPYMGKKSIYSDGKWIILKKDILLDNISNKVRHYYAYLDLLPRLSNTDAVGNTFKYFHTLFTHEPYAINSRGEIISEGYPDPDVLNYTGGNSAYYSAKEFIRLLNNYIKWMKQENIYDNTMIIIVSDHGNYVVDDNPFKPEGIEMILGSGEMFNRINALLMVKGFNDRGPLNIEKQLMSNFDVPALIHNGLEMDPYIPIPKKRKLTFSMLEGSYHGHLDRDVSKFSVWQVEGSIDKTENWMKVE